MQDVEGGRDFGDGIAEQADADGVADAVEQDRAETARRLDGRIRRLARFGDADVRRIVRLLGVEPVCFDDGGDIRRLQRHDEIVIADGFSDLDVAKGAVDHGGRAGEPVLHGEFAFEGAGIDADPHRDALVLRLPEDLLEAIHAADVARVDADLVDRMIEGGEGHLVVEMDVADERYLDPPPDLAENRGVFRLRHRDANQLAAGLLEPMDLGDGGLELMRIGRGHRLDDDRIVAADGHAADDDDAGLVTLEGGLVHTCSDLGRNRHPGNPGDGGYLTRVILSEARAESEKRQAETTMRYVCAIASCVLGGVALFAAIVLFLFGYPDSVEGYELVYRDDVGVGALLASAFVIGRLSQDRSNRRRKIATACGFVAIWLAVSGVLLAAHAAVAHIRFSPPRRLVTTNRLVFAQHALHDFARDCGRFPTTEEGLAGLVRNSGLVEWKGPYLEVNELSDGYEQLLRYELVGNRYDVWSIGSDGVDGTDDDVRWDAETHDTRWGKAR